MPTPKIVYIGLGTIGQMTISGADYVLINGVVSGSVTSRALEIGRFGVFRGTAHVGRFNLFGTASGEVTADKSCYVDMKAEFTGAMIRPKAAKGNFATEGHSIPHHAPLSPSEQSTTDDSTPIAPAGGTEIDLSREDKKRLAALLDLCQMP